MKINSFYKILIIGYSTSIFAEGILLPIYAVFVQKIGGTILDASGAIAVFLITQGIFTVLAHRLRWIDKNRIAVMAGGWLIWVCGIALYLFVSNVFMLMVTQVLTALGNALADPIFDRELAAHTDHKGQEFEWGFFEGNKDLVQGVASIVGGLVVSFFGFRILIYTMVFSATASLLIILFYISKIKTGLRARLFG